ncbi:MAG: serine/threonine-protein kinase [Burkholderiales bacterium]
MPPYVRVCPVCDTENPPELARCACGATLTGIDFSIPRTAASETQSPAPAMASAEAEASAAAQPVMCPYRDCAQPNAPGTQRCVYCNRPLHAQAAQDEPVVDARPLPSALRDRYRVVEAFPATGAEADILLVTDRRTGGNAVAKLYRRGIAPDVRLLAILAQSVGDTVVRVLDHGVSDGAAYEILEYVPGGTLEQLMREGPLPRDDVRAIVREIADALAGIHVHGILHRDLKPENVLVRSRSPLRLALTDFGIASMSDATQHFTSAARTTKYAAPEVLTGVLDAKSDWWSLGMIVLEAASGRHPFDGLSEQVMNHQLATRPIDVRGVYDDALRVLCRGLLLRDPSRRFGREEVSRWLDGDATLAAPEESQVGNVRPYRFGTAEATTANELALALARHWDEAKRDIARGHVARWLENELHDHNLLRTLQDIQDRRGLGEDGKLLAFLLAAAPDLPPVWKGRALGDAPVLAAAREAAQGDVAATEWLDSVAGNDVLASYATAGHPSLGSLDARWREGWQAFLKVWNRAREAETAWRRAPRDVGGGKAVSFDDLVYASPQRLAAPEARIVNGALLVALHDPAYVEALRGQVQAGLARVAGYCPWYEDVANASLDDPMGVLACHALLAVAKEDADAEEKRLAASARARAQACDEARADLRVIVEGILGLLPTGDEDLEREHVSALLDLFTELDGACVKVARLEFADAAYEDLRRHTEKLASFGAAAQRALARAEEVHGTNAVFFQSHRLAIAGAILAFVALVRVPAALVVLVAVAALALGYRWLRGFSTTEEALKKLRVFGLHARNFLRAGEKQDAP